MGMYFHCAFGFFLKRNLFPSIFLKHMVAFNGDLNVAATLAYATTSLSGNFQFAKNILSFQQSPAEMNIRCSCGIFGNLQFSFRFFFKK